MRCFGIESAFVCGTEQNMLWQRTENCCTFCFFFLLFTIHLFPNGWGMLCFSWFSPVLLPRSLSVSLIKQFICGVSRGFSRNVDIFSRSMHQNYGGKLIGLSFLTNIICLINCCSSLFIFIPLRNRCPIVLWRCLYERCEKLCKRVIWIAVDPTKFTHVEFTFFFCSMETNNSLALISRFYSVEPHFHWIVLCFIQSCVINELAQFPIIPMIQLIKSSSTVSDNRIF